MLLSASCRPATTTNATAVTIRLRVSTAAAITPRITAQIATPSRAMRHGLSW
jgi:hypothetical protein